MEKRQEREQMRKRIEALQASLARMAPVEDAGAPPKVAEAIDLNPRSLEISRPGMTSWTS